MIDFILNEQDVSTDQPSGSTVLDFIRYHKNLKGTKIGCREGDCGACTVLVGELAGETVKYRTMTSCLMPLANAAGKHIVSIEGINPADGSLTPVQQALVDESGTQCGFCTVGFVMSLTGFCLGTRTSLSASEEQAISSIDGNICRCTGYKSIERAALELVQNAEPPASAGGQPLAVKSGVVPPYFSGIASRLDRLRFVRAHDFDLNHPLTQVVPPSIRPLTQAAPTRFVSGGTDLYVQRHDEMTEAESFHVFYNYELRSIRDTGTDIEIGASATVTDLLESGLMNEMFPDLYKHLKLVSSTPIRNMATLAGNLVNASPIGDMTVWFLALDAEIDLNCTIPRASKSDSRTLSLKDLYLGYKHLAKQPDEYITAVRFQKPTSDFRFNFDKVCKRTYLDIASVNTAISLERRQPTGTFAFDAVHVAVGGVAPIPLYLKQTSEFLRNREINDETIAEANKIMQNEISPISDVRGTETYKRLLLRQLLRAHFHELFEKNAV